MFDEFPLEFFFNLLSLNGKIVYSTLFVIKRTETCKETAISTEGTTISIANKEGGSSFVTFVDKKGIYDIEQLNASQKLCNGIIIV